MSDLEWLSRRSVAEAREVELLRVLDFQPEWMADAACREHPEVNFFPTRGEPADPAKQVCAGCLVRSECLDYALNSNIYYGVWGGTSDRERRAIRRRLKLGQLAA